MLWRKVLFVIAICMFVASNLAAAIPEAWNKLFPAGLIDRDGNPVAVDTLAGKYIGIYYAADWCSSCKGFSPGMVAFRNANASEFEVVFVSSDKNKAEQFKYMKNLDMQWPAVEYRSPAALALRERFKVSSIPTLVVLSPDGGLITVAGRAYVENDPEAAMNLWKSTEPSPLPFEAVAPSLAGSVDRLKTLDQQLVEEVRLRQSMPRHGLIEGTIGEKSYSVAFDKTSLTIKGQAGEKVIDIQVDAEGHTMKGFAHGTPVDIVTYLNPDEHRQEGEVYGIFYWNGINWPAGQSMGGVSCSILELFWNVENGTLNGYLGERKLDLRMDAASSRMTGELFGRKVDLQFTDLDITDFVRHFYLFLK